MDETLIGPAALTDPRWDVPPVAPGQPGTVAWLRAHVARFSHRDEHTSRRTQVTEELAHIDPETLQHRAFDAALQRLRGAAPADAVAAVRAVPVEVLAEALGVGDVPSTGAGTVAGTVPGTVAGTTPGTVAATVAGSVPGAVAAAVLTLAPAYLPPAVPDAAADAAVARLVEAFGGAADEATANRIGLLAQACTATATLIANAAQRLGGGSASDVIALTLDEDPPARTTRRTATRPVLADGRDWQAGTTVRVDLTRTPFGAGPHACPGQAHAVALAIGVIGALQAISAEEAS